MHAEGDSLSNADNHSRSRYPAVYYLGINALMMEGLLLGDVKGRSIAFVRSVAIKLEFVPI